MRPVNDAPGAEDDEAVAERGWPLEVEVLGNDDDLNGDRLIVSDVSDPEHGGATASEEGRLVRYVPDIAATPNRTPLPTPSRTARGTDTATVDVVVRDATAPGILRVRPEDGKKTASVFAHPRAVFSEDLDAASAKADGVFTLIRKSTGGEVPARVRYEAESRRLVLMPEDDLKRGER